jgi:TorA maturation chaperone TorD
MRQLCLREIDQWSCGMDATTTLAKEEEFLRDHLGSWAGEYCAQAGKYARTEFYRGFLAVLDDFISIEMEYLQQNPTSIFYKNLNQ